MTEDANGYLFAGVYTTGFTTGNAAIYKSIDGGANWFSVYFDSSARHIHCIEVDKSNNYIYASVGDERIAPQWHTSVIRATDGAVSNSSWQKIFTLPQILVIQTVTTLDTTGKLVPVARLLLTDYDNGQIYRTVDDQAFTLVLDTGSQCYGYWIRTDDQNSNIFASFTGGEHPNTWVAGIWLSTNGGITWSLYKSFPIHYAYFGSSMASNFKQGTMYYCLQLDTGWQNGIKVSHSIATATSQNSMQHPLQINMALLGLGILVTISALTREVLTAPKQYKTKRVICGLQAAFHLVPDTAS